MPAAHLFWPVERWRSLQYERLVHHIRHAASSPLYAKLDLPSMVAHAHGSIELLLSQLPLTTKDQLAIAGADAWAVAPDQVAEWVCTSGTSGKPLHVPLTRLDLDRLAENEGVALGIAGVGRKGASDDLFVMAVGMDRMFVAGLAYWLGAQRLGVTCVRVGPQMGLHPEMLAELLERIDASSGRRIFVITVPSFVTGATPPKNPLAGIICIGEPIRSESLTYNLLGQRLHDRFDCPITSTYAATETCTTFAEGPACNGGHLNPALATLEILDDADRPVPASQVGEVVITSLGMTGMPLLRFRTGDMAAMFTEPCACGRTTPRLGPILGRRQQLLKLRGTSVFPSAIIERCEPRPKCSIVSWLRNSTSRSAIGFAYSFTRGMKRRRHEREWSAACVRCCGSLRRSNS